MVMVVPVPEVAQQPAKIAVVTSARTPEIPRDVRKSSSGRFMRAKITLSPTGKTLRCELLQESGDKVFDKASCDAFMASKYKPAVDRAGQPAYGTVAATNVFVNPREKFDYPANADVVLAVSRMPEGAAAYDLREAAVAVDAAGNALTCDNIVKGPVGPLDKALCNTALRQLHFAPALDESGKPVSSVQSFSVMFTAQDADKIVVKDDSPRRK